MEKEAEREGEGGLDGKPSKDKKKNGGVDGHSFFSFLFLLFSFSFHYLSFWGDNGLLTKVDMLVGNSSK